MLGCLPCCEKMAVLQTPLMPMQTRDREWSSIGLKGSTGICSTRLPAKIAWLSFVAAQAEDNAVNVETGRCNKLTLMWQQTQHRKAEQLQQLGTRQQVGHSLTNGQVLYLSVSSFRWG